MRLLLWPDDDGDDATDQTVLVWEQGRIAGWIHHLFFMPLGRGLYPNARCPLSRAGSFARICASVALDARWLPPSRTGQRGRLVSMKLGSNVAVANRAVSSPIAVWVLSQPTGFNISERTLGSTKFGW